MSRIVKFFAGSGLQSVIAFVFGVTLAFTAFETFDRFIDDPAIREAGRKEKEAEVRKATEAAREKARIERLDAERFFAAAITQLTAEIAGREQEIESLIDDFNTRPDARDPSGIDGRFVR